MGIKDAALSIANNPKVLLAAGIVGFVGAGVWACVQTLKLEKIVDEQNDILDEIKENNTEEEMQLPAVKKEVAVTRAKTIGRIVWNYTGPVLVAGVAGYLLCRSYGIQRRNYMLMSAAYASASKAYNMILDRVEQKWGEEGLKYVKYGIEQRDVEKEIVDEKGKTKKIKEKEDFLENPNYAAIKAISPNAIIFDEETNLYQMCGGSIVKMKSELTICQNADQVQYNAGIPVFYNDIVRTTCGNDPRWLTDIGQITGCYKWDPENRAAVKDTVDYRISTFTGTDPETGDPKQYVYIDPLVSLIDLDKNRQLYPTGDLQKFIHSEKFGGRKRIGGKYNSQVAV
jgi:hypothetical protein